MCLLEDDSRLETEEETQDTILNHNQFFAVDFQGRFLTVCQIIVFNVNDNGI